MATFDMKRFDGIFGMTLFGGAFSTFIVNMVCKGVSRIPASLPEVIETVLRIGTYTLLTGVLVLISGTVLLLVNAIRTRRSGSEGTPTAHVLIVSIITIALLVISLLL